MSNGGGNYVLYATGMLGPHAPGQNEAAIQAVQESGFTTVVLWTLHVGSDGVFMDGGSPIYTWMETGAGPSWPFLNPGYEVMGKQIQQLKANGSSVTRVLFSIGSGGSGTSPPPPDFANLKALLAADSDTVKRNVQALKDLLYLDGFDFDCEEYDQDYTSTIVQLSLLMNQLGLMVTYCPYSSSNLYNGAPNFWESCLAQVYAQNNNQQAVSWMNLQCYGGGTGNSPSAWVDSLQSYGELGIADPGAFIVPGYGSVHIPANSTTCSDEPSQGLYCPADVQSNFASIASSGAGITGGFIWNTTNIFNCAAPVGNDCNCGITLGAYLSAISNGLSGTT